MTNHYIDRSKIEPCSQALSGLPLATEQKTYDTHCSNKRVVLSLQNQQSTATIDVEFKPHFVLELENQDSTHTLALHKTFINHTC